MQFCKDCGGVLNLFGNNDGDLCPACIQHQKKLALPQAAERRPEAPESMLAGAELSLENGRMVLRSPEGWELWSAPAGVRTTLQAMLASAGRIYQIRRRRRQDGRPKENPT